IPSALSLIWPAAARHRMGIVSPGPLGARPAEPKSIGRRQREPTPDVLLVDVQPAALLCRFARLLQPHRAESTRRLAPDRSLCPRPLRSPTTGGWLPGGSCPASREDEW